MPGSRTFSFGRLTLFFLSIAAWIFWQYAIVKLTVKSHYEVLGIDQNSTTEDIQDAYDNLISLRSAADGNHKQIKLKILQIQHAYEVLSDPIRRRDYDHFHFDELQDLVNNLTKSVGNIQYHLPTPLWEPFVYDLSSCGASLVPGNFTSFMEGKEPFLLQVYSVGSRKCMIWEPSWTHICEKMDGVALAGRLEIGETKLSAYFADKNQASGSLSFRHGLPAYLAFPSDCRNQDCMIRYEGEMGADEVVNWFSSHILRLPSIMYYSPHNFVKEFLHKSGIQKVKVVTFTTTGERASPFLRKAAKDFWEYAAFSLVRWREEDAVIWQNMLGIQSAPALVFIKDPGIAPVIYYGSHNSSQFLKLMQEHKSHVLPQLRSITAKDLGCSETGHSLAGKGTHTWYCVIVAGRPSFELSQARAVLRGVQHTLANEISDIYSPSVSIAASAFKQKRLTFVWLDGQAQKQVCYFYLNLEAAHEACGTKGYTEQTSIPHVAIVRYRRHPNDGKKLAKKSKYLNSLWQKFLEEEEILASQIVAVYNGTLEVSELTSWVSTMVKEGDVEDLLFYMKRAPALTPEESRPAWLVDAQDYMSRKRAGIFRKCKIVILGFLDHLKQPGFKPLLVVVLVIYLGKFMLKPPGQN